MTSKYQLAGLDDLGRGFNRQADMKVTHETVQAIFRYETCLVETEPHVTEQAALASLIAGLQKRGYTQLRSRLQFRGAAYLGNQATWEEHQDTETGILPRWFHALRTEFRRLRRAS